MRQSGDARHASYAGGAGGSALELRSELTGELDCGLYLYPPDGDAFDDPEGDAEGAAVGNELVRAFALLDAAPTRTVINRAGS